MATGVVLAPAVSALDPTVRGDICILQATAQDRQDFRQAVAATRSDVVRHLRQELPSVAEDIDVLAGAAPETLYGAGDAADPAVNAALERIREVSPQAPARNRLPDGRNGGGDPEPGSGQK